MMIKAIRTTELLDWLRLRCSFGGKLRYYDIPKRSPWCRATWPLVFLDAEVMYQRDLEPGEKMDTVLLDCIECYEDLEDDIAEPTLLKWRPRGQITVHDLALMEPEPGLTCVFERVSLYRCNYQLQRVEHRGQGVEVVG